MFGGWVDQGLHRYFVQLIHNPRSFPVHTLKRIAIAVTLAAGATSAAMATTFAVGSLPTAPASYTNLSPETVGAISDTYNFTLASTSSVFGAVSSVDLLPFFNVGSLVLQLYTSGNVLLATGTTGTPAGEDSTITGTTLTSGSYYFRVTGTATGPSGGFTAFVASATPVPEPKTYALMIAGMVGIGFTAMRRRG